MKVLINGFAVFCFNKKVSYSKTGLTVPSSAVTKLGWTVFEEVQTKNGSWLQCKVDDLFQRRVLLEVFDQKQFFNLSRCDILI